MYLQPAEAQWAVNIEFREHGSRGHWGHCLLPHSATETANQFVNIKSSNAIRLLHLDENSQKFYFFLIQQETPQGL